LLKGEKLDADVYRQRKLKCREAKKREQPGFTRRRVLGTAEGKNGGVGPKTKELVKSLNRSLTSQSGAVLAKLGPQRQTE